MTKRELSRLRRLRANRQFRDGPEALIHMPCKARVAVMCAEAVPWRCHRSLIADALSIRGVPVVEIFSESTWCVHKFTPFARIEGARIICPTAKPMLL